MVRLWWQALTQKVLRARVLRRTSRPAWRLRVRPRFDALENRVLMSNWNMEPPGLLAPPTPTIGDVPASAPAYAGRGYKHGLDVADNSDPGWDKLLQDVLGPRPTQPGPSGPGLASDGNGSTFGQPKPQSGGSRPESLVDKGDDRGGLPAADPFRPRGSQTAPVVAPEVQRSRGAPGQSATLLARASKVEHATADQASQARVADVAVARSGEAGVKPAGPETTDVAAQPGQAGAAKISTVRGTFPQSPSDLPDGPLLHRYVAHREETAFTALVQRHERLVFGVCRRVLGDSHAALDASQATFLVLARKASGLDKDNPLAGWLYKVAYHLALRLRGVAARQRRREKEAAHGRSAETVSDGSAAIEKQELREALREELQRLPEKYRAPLVLCYFDGQTHDEAARAIGLPRGSLAKRIGEGLERLRERLTDRGFML